MVQHVKSRGNMAYISGIGAGECDQRTYEMAYQVGREAGWRGAIVVCGGLGGVMAGAARGAREVGGLAVWILPGENRLGSSSYLQVALPTGLGQAR
ncbi:SLOG cluster 4 domain-containing protein, partial [Candidatus Hakubella thermalkaliphila]